MIINWNRFIVSRLSKMRDRRIKVADLSTKLRLLLHEKGVSCPGETNIIPVIIGEPEKTVDIALQLQEDGYFILPVRPPAVPPNSSRLRISVTASMNYEDLKSFIEKLVRILP